MLGVLQINKTNRVSWKKSTQERVSAYHSKHQHFKQKLDQKQKISHVMNKHFCPSVGRNAQFTPVHEHHISEISKRPHKNCNDLEKRETQVEPFPVSG
jgi:hypothetical protein